MSNWRNEEALATLIAACRVSVTANINRGFTMAQAREVAKEVIEQGGVLVPSALTNEQVSNLFDVPEGHAESRRQSLEAVARESD